MTENVSIVPEVEESSPKRKFDLKKVAKTAGAASAVLLVAVGAYKLGASGEDAETEETVDKTVTKSTKKAE